MKRLLLITSLFIQPAFAHHTGNHTGRSVTATTYHEWYHGRTTYCGQTYQHWDLSAAHPWLECGTKVRVTHGSRTLVVPITDRCDCNIDLSAGAAHRLKVPLNGIGLVRLDY